ncbi:hypothetical protein P4B35_23810, partial [Pontiellaceae bacterium B12227]|nr:hypothetical protein [Pontiellaceae bacterium B12227]
RDGRAMAGWAGDAVGVGVSRNHATTAAPPDRQRAKLKDLEEGAGAGAFLAYAESVTDMGQRGEAKPRGEAGARRGCPLFQRLENPMKALASVSARALLQPEPPTGGSSKADLTEWVLFKRAGCKKAKCAKRTHNRGYATLSGPKDSAPESERVRRRRTVRGNGVTVGASRQILLKRSGETAAGVRPKAPTPGGQAVGPRRKNARAAEGEKGVCDRNALSRSDQPGFRSVVEALEPNLRGVPRRAKAGQAGRIR